MILTMTIEQTFDLHSLKTFENRKKNYVETLVQKILNCEQIIDDDSKIPIVVPWEGFQPLILSHDPYLE